MSHLYHQANAYAGLGIDLGSRSSTRDSAPSLRQHRSRRLSTSAIDRRRVRIASGVPAVLGHGAEYVKSEYGMSSEEMHGESDHHSSSSSNSSRKHRRSLSIAAVHMSSDSDSTGYGWSSEGFDTPNTESSSTSHSPIHGADRKATHLRSAMKAPSQLRKQMSHPALRLDSAGTDDGARPNMGFTRRTQSNTNLQSSYELRDSSCGYSSTTSSNFESHQSGTSLGRTSGIPRTASRSTLLAMRRAQVLVNDAKCSGPSEMEASSTHLLHPTSSANCSQSPVKMIRDGFGGWVEAAAAADQIRPPSILSVGHYSIQATEIGAYDDAQDQNTSQRSQAGNAPSSGRPRSYSVADVAIISAKTVLCVNKAEPPSLRVGSIYNQDGHETARLQPVPSRSATSPPEAAKVQKAVSMRSLRGFAGLEGAERGETMVTLDPWGHAFVKGDPIAAGHVHASKTRPLLPLARPAPNRASTLATADRATVLKALAGAPSGASLERQSTLLATTGNQARRSRDLNRLLSNGGGKAAPESVLDATGNSAPAPSRLQGITESSSSLSTCASTLSRGDTLDPTAALPAAVLEQSKSVKTARVQVDIVLESDLIVEGGTLRGHLEIKVRKPNDKDGRNVMISQPKVRVVGFEDLESDDTRHIFYHHAALIDADHPSIRRSQPYVLHGSPAMSSPQPGAKPLLPCFVSLPDDEGYCVARVGNHSLPFSLEIPIGKGAKGSYRGKHATVRYIVIGSVKLKSADSTDRTIAHFYRHIDLYPYLNPAVVLSSAQSPLQATASKGLLFGGPGKVHLTASLHRATWVAGQRVHIKVDVNNETTKKIKSMSLSLIRTVTLFRPRPELIAGYRSGDGGYDDPDACSTTTSRKKISEQTLEMGQKGSGGVVTARGWWTGVESCTKVESSHFMCLPTDALSISRGRHVEVVYSIKVSVGSSLSTDVSVELPLRVINFVSLDPPPTSYHKNARNTTSFISPAQGKEDPLIARLRTLSADSSHSVPQVTHSSLAERHNVANASSVASDTAVSSTGGNPARTLQHQQSLDFINSAIRSAKARRAPPASGPAPLGLGIGLSDTEDEDGYSRTESSDEGPTLAKSHAPMPPSLVLSSMQLALEAQLHHRGQMPMGVPALETHVPGSSSIDYEEDELAFDAGDRTLGLNDDSLDEVDSVVGSATQARPPVFESRVDDEDGEDLLLEERMESVEEEEEEPTMHEGDVCFDVDDVDASFESMSTLRGSGEHRCETDVESVEEEHEGGSSPLGEISQRSLQHRPLLILQQREASAEAVKVNDAGSTSCRSEMTASLSRAASPTKTPRASSPYRVASPSKTPRSGVASPPKPNLTKQPSFTYASPSKPLKTKPSRASVAPGACSETDAPGAPRYRIRRAANIHRPRGSRGRGRSSQGSDSSSASGSSVGRSLDATEATVTPAVVASARESAVGPAADERACTLPDSASKVLSSAAAKVQAQRKVALSLSTKSSLPSLREATCRSSTKVTLPSSSTSTPVVSDSDTGANLSLHRTTSTHNLRGAAVVLPSVRNKIAMLESRTSVLQNFTLGAKQSGTSSMSSGPSSPARIPSRGLSSSSSVPAVVGSRNSPSASAASPTRVRVPASASMVRSTGSQVLLGRKLSTMSNASEDSMASAKVPAYMLRRADSLASFKAPVLRGRR